MIAWSLKYRPAVEDNKSHNVENKQLYSGAQFLHSHSDELCWVWPHPAQICFPLRGICIHFNPVKTFSLHLDSLQLFIKWLIVNAAGIVVNWYGHACCKTYSVDLKRKHTAPSECFSDYYFDRQHVR